jgi:predicted methyltransferase
VLDRVNKIAASEWLHGKSVAVLGDDDGISVALAAFTDVESVTVIDIDPEVIAFLESLAAEMGVEIEIRLHDLRKPLPDDLKGRFWLVNADPPQNAKGERFFLEQAFTLLQPELGHRVYCSITPFWMGFERYHEIMGFLLSRGFVSVDVHTDIMAFPVSAPTMASSYKHAKSRHFVETALGSLTNMVCDIHVLHRAKHS